MHPKTGRVVLGAGMLVLTLLGSVPVRARVAGATLFGTITDPAGAIVPNATMSVKYVATGQAIATRTDSAGRYEVPNLMPGDYEVSVSAEGFSTNVATVTIRASARQALNLTLRAALALEDLGFSPAQTLGSAQDQARLDKRSHMLQLHQRLGLITVVPLAATLISSTVAAGKNSSSTARDLHGALGAVTAGLYLTSAYYAIFAPKVPGTKTRGPIRLHKVLAWIHGPGMILTPVLGAMAFAQRSRGERVHGIASAHGAVAVVTAAAYGAAILSVSIKFLKRTHVTRKILLALSLVAQPTLAQTDGQWVLEQPTLTYHVSHPLHQVDGVSHAARGKGVCHAGRCDFLIAVPLKSFDSGDSNRDLHTLQVTRGGQYPMITVRTRLPETASVSATIHADLEIQFAGQTATYKDVPFEQAPQGNETRISGTIPTTLSDLKIDRPSLLAIPVKNEIPVRVDMTWRREK